ncbi:hypothetical protein [Actimicrobium antarcticum]|uniref:Uncharacterized protein n=1 Tax=Actimicrobium antarcticum TaxID=1051899 RepID=A0ABP7SQG1_9BURK
MHSPELIRPARSRGLVLLLVLTAAGVFSGCALLAPPVATANTPLGKSALAQAWPSGSIVTVVLAEQALQASTAQRAAIEQAYLQDQTNCFDKFFMTACNDKGKERRRIALADVRAIEVEANYVKRRDRADERDKALAARDAEDQAAAPQRLLDIQAREKAAAIKAAERAGNADKEQASQQRQVGIDPQLRQREYDAKAAQQQATDAARQAQRATNTADFQKKAANAAERQKQVADNKAKKLAERAARDVADKKAAEQAAAAAATK